ncbi:hypothetical protein FY528_17300 [Hymenobacter lutimineralis]|uniref:Uncharacterized protein n=1 Tax=Hymenobacter lutimineralis TaxID=2606448 RepID=A0A5D6USV0_9BACT|nr:hypothetical protein [Hymenobacter lutimineralis]TYZ06626.1 hypothetical protein FY528_17300 [Hymenobacter lutimineralis]
MKQFFLLLALFSTLAASAQVKTERKKYLRPKKDEECQYVQNVTKNTDEDAEVSASVTRLAYRPYTELLLELNEQRKYSTWADSAYQRRLNNLPAGGVLIVTMLRRGSTNANPSYLSLVVKDKDEKELLNIPSLPDGDGRFWNRDLYKSQRTIPFVKTLEPQALRVIINDAKLKEDFEYIVNTQ